MPADILIDLGADWGHIVPLNVLEEITHIQFHTDGHIEVTCEFDHEERRRPFVFKSRKAFTDEDGEAQKKRLLSYSNGLVPKEDVQFVVDTLAEQAGVEVDELIKGTTCDISSVRRLWATMNGEPYFRFTFQYDPEEKTMNIDELHNDLFMGIPADWSDPEVMKTLSHDEQVIMMIYEIIYGMAEPILPEPEGGAMMDPDANIPAMGQGIRSAQQVDLSMMGPNNKMSG